MTAAEAATICAHITKTLCYHDNTSVLATISSIWNGTMFGDHHWPLNASRGFVSISWASCHYCATQICIARTCYGATAMWLGGWLAGWVSVTRRYCIKTAKPILKLFPPSGSPIILVSSDHCADTQSQGNPFTGCVKYTRWVKLATFDGNRRLSRKRCEISRWLLWNANRKSWVPDWTV